MAISAYVGIPGSGKSYEVVSNVIIPAFLAGRRIVTNIYGITDEKIRDYCISKKKANSSALGKVIFVENEQVQDALFFPYLKDSGISEDSFCKAGDLICIDETWRIWESDKIPEQHRSFIAEHRHFASDNGITCDLVVLNQSVANLPRFIKDRVETTYRMSKLVALGLRNRYRVDIFSGIKLFNKYKTTSYQCKYNKAIFPLYDSHVGGQGKELVVDKRQNVFRQGKLWFIIIGLLLLVMSSLYFLHLFFNVNTSSIDERQPESVINKPVANSLLPTVAKPVISTQWRIAGKIEKGGEAWAILINSQGFSRIEPLSQFNFSGVMMTGEIDGERVTTYSGAVK